MPAQRLQKPIIPTLTPTYLLPLSYALSRPLLSQLSASGSPLAIALVATLLCRQLDNMVRTLYQGLPAPAIPARSELLVRLADALRPWDQVDDIRAAVGKLARSSEGHKCTNCGKDKSLLEFAVLDAGAWNRLLQAMPAVS